MDNLTIIDTFVHEKRVFSHNFSYLKHKLHIVYSTTTIINDIGTHISL